MSDHLLFRHLDTPNLNQIAIYKKHGGFARFQKSSHRHATSGSY